MLMKQHSYTFYNGHLSEVHNRREILRRNLKQLEQAAMVEASSASTLDATSLSISYLEHNRIQSDLTRRRKNHKSHSGNVEERNISQVAAAIESGEPLNIDQVHIFERIVILEIDALNEDLKGKASTSHCSYPKNLTIKNHYEYIVLPTLVYEVCTKPGL